MAKVDYAGITRELATIFNAEEETKGVRVFIEEEPAFGLADLGDAISVYLMGRAAHSAQSIAAGKRTRFLVRILITCYSFSMERFEAAEAARDDLIGRAELVLMRYPSLNGKVTMSWLEGGDFASAKAPGSSTFVSAGEINLTADVSAINT